MLGYAFLLISYPLPMTTWASEFVNFSQAFDKVWHRGLIHKMNSYDIKGPLIKWFENYLYQRKLLSP
jgi:Na+-translocating ferredoxin:NAD+ oxidoreductase RnfD subunit